MVDHRKLFEDVCRAVERAGFSLAAPGEPGMHVGHRPQGVVISWRRATGQALLLAALLERAGHTVVRRDADLLITARSGAPIR